MDRVKLDTPEFVSFLAAIKKRDEEYMEKNFSTLPKNEFRVSEGGRYIRITRRDSAHCFIDKTNGDVLKPATWKAPAKHARGNIFDASNGLSKMGVYGPAYLR